MFCVHLQLGGSGFETRLSVLSSFFPQPKDVDDGFTGDAKCHYFVQRRPKLSEQREVVAGAVILNVSLHINHFKCLKLVATSNQKELAHRHTSLLPGCSSACDSSPLGEKTKARFGAPT